MTFFRPILIALAAASGANAAAPDSLMHRSPIHVKKNTQDFAAPQARVGQRPQSRSVRTVPAAVIPADCPEPGAFCGYVQVPLDRRHPSGQKIKIYFEQYPHTNPGPAESAIVMNFGGPGGSTTGSRDFAQFIFAANLDSHDLLLIDDRGRGLSGAIDCPDLQHGPMPLAQAEATCAAQLGAAASRYGSGDIAADIEAVRTALGYDQLDFFGASYGGIDATAYATRFGEHLRSVVLDAPLGEPAINEFLRLQFRTHSDPRMIRLVCRRSILCAADHPTPADDLEDLIDSLRRHPVEGDSFDANGTPVHIRVDEDALLNFVVTYPSGNFISTGEIPAAAAALKRGDPAPLLRLAAEGQFTIEGDSGNATKFSSGAYYATGCVDAQQPWDWNDSVAERKRDYARAVRNLPDDFFAPFSNEAPAGLLFSTLGKQCLWWEKPTPSSPVVAPHGNYPPVPTLVLDGDLDNRVPLEETRLVAGRFPKSTFVKVAGVGHYTIGGSQCARDLVSQFIEDLHVGDTTCAASPKVISPAVGRFPLLAKEAMPAAADPSGNNQAGPGERKTVSVAVAAAIDALQRSSIGFGTGVGLRGGSFSTDYGDGSVWTATLSDVAFAKDVIVNGTIIWQSDNSIVADLTVSGSGTAGGKLHVGGAWQVAGVVGNFKVSGTLGGKRVAALVPEA